MKIVVGQGSCGIATGAKKVANRFEEILGEKNIDINVDITGCIGTCFRANSGYIRRWKR